MSDTQLLIADHALNIFHLAIVVTLLFGWIFPQTRRLHRWAVGITAFCWLVVGLVVGKIGYCPVTSWHWDVKRLRGETNLPASYIDYLLQIVGMRFTPAQVDFGVGFIFVCLVLIALYFWQREQRVP
jgi:hypothetical protein